MPAAGLAQSTCVPAATRGVITTSAHPSRPDALRSSRLLSPSAKPALDTAEATCPVSLHVPAAGHPGGGGRGTAEWAGVTGTLLSVQRRDRECHGHTILRNPRGRVTSPIVTAPHSAYNRDCRADARYEPADTDPRGVRSQLFWRGRTAAGALGRPELPTPVTAIDARSATSRRWHHCSGPCSPGRLPPDLPIESPSTAPGWRSCPWRAAPPASRR